MNPKQFFIALNKATIENKLKWSLLPKKHYHTITNIWDGIVDAYYTEYKENTKIVVYQYRGADIHESSNISHFISICDDGFNYSYEFTQNEIEVDDSEMYIFYKRLQRSANKIDDFMADFIKDFE